MLRGREFIWEEVEKFRTQFHQTAITTPIDVFTLVEIELRLDVIPLTDLFEKYDVDAALVPDFSGIYVDQAAYALWEKGPVWKEKRLRFSLAHELGHFVLHRELARSLHFKDFEDFFAWINDSTGLYERERAANEFAGRLLVPRDILAAQLEEVKAIDSHWRGNPRLREGFASKVAPKFGVSDAVIEVRLDREDLWPAS